MHRFIHKKKEKNALAATIAPKSQEVSWNCWGLEEVKKGFGFLVTEEKTLVWEEFWEVLAKLLYP